jgi:hypothetical protein
MFFKNPRIVLKLLIMVVKDLRNEFIFLFGDGVLPEKKK